MNLDLIDQNINELKRQLVVLDNTVPKTRLESITIEQRKRQIQHKLSGAVEKRNRWINDHRDEVNQNNQLNTLQNDLMDTTEDGYLQTPNDNNKRASFSLDDEMVSSFSQNDLDEFLDEEDLPMERVTYPNLTTDLSKTRSLPQQQQSMHYPTRGQIVYSYPEQRLPIHLQHLADNKRKQEFVHPNTTKIVRKPLAASLMQPITNTPSIYPLVNNATSPIRTSTEIQHPQYQLNSQIPTVKDYSKLHQELDQISESASVLKSVLARDEEESDIKQKRERERLLKDLMNTVTKHKERMARILGELTDEDPRILERAMSVNEELHTAILAYRKYDETHHETLSSKLANVGNLMSSFIGDYLTGDKKSPRKNNQTEKQSPRKNDQSPRKNNQEKPSPRKKETPQAYQPPTPPPNMKKSKKIFSSPAPINNENHNNHDNELEYNDKELFMEDDCYPKLTEHEMEDFDEVLDRFEEQIAEEDEEQQFDPRLLIPHQLSPDASTSSESIGPGYHILAHVKKKPSNKNTKKKPVKKNNAKPKKGVMNVVVVPPPSVNKPVLKHIIEKNKDKIIGNKLPTDKGDLKDRIHSLLDTMRETEEEIVKDDADKELDQLEEHVEGEEDEEEEYYDDEYDDDYQDDEEEAEEEDEETAKERILREEMALEEELRELENQVERDRKLERASNNKQVRYIDHPFFVNEFSTLERELSSTNQKKRVLEYFFYRVTIFF